MAFTGTPPDFRVMQVPTAAQVLLSVATANRIRTDVEWSEELLTYLSVVFTHDGVFCPPPPCEFVDVHGSNYGVDCDKVKEHLQPNLKIMGAICTLFDRRNRLARQVVNEVRTHFPGPVFEAVVPRSVRLAEAPSFGKSILDFDAFSKGARAYKQAAREIIIWDEKGKSEKVV
jgi:chromosome partitioning protein